MYEIAKGGGIFGWDDRNKINDKGAHGQSVNNSYKGLIEVLLYGKDHSGGAFYWHGSDLEKPTKNSHAHERFYLVGFKFTNTAHDTWNIGDRISGNSKWNYKYESTGVGGNTTFMKLTDEWIRANNYKGKW